MPLRQVRCQSQGALCSTLNFFKLRLAQALEIPVLPDFILRQICHGESELRVTRDRLLIP